MKEYLSKYKYHVIWAGILVLLVHGAKLNSNIVGIDTEDLIHLGTPFYDGWLNTGRQGLVLLKYLTASVEYNPYFAGLMTLVFLMLSVTAFMMLWDRTNNMTKSSNMWIAVGCMALWVSHPVLVEQFYFTLQGAEIGMGMLLTVLALWLVYRAGQQKGRTKLVFYGLCTSILVLTFSIYQIFVVFFIFGAVTLLILDVLHENSVKKGISGVVRDVVPYVGVFLAAFVCNSIITKLFFSESDYLSSQIRWGQLSLRDCIYTIAVHGRDVLTGQNSIFYDWTYGILCVIGLLAVVMLVKRYGFSLIFYYVALMTTPFLMTVVCADVPAIRSQLVLPAMTGFVLYLDVILVTKLVETEKAKKGEHRANIIFWQNVVLMAVCLIGVVSQMQVSLRLYYTDACRYAEDEALGRALIEELEPLIGEDDTPIVVIGSHEFHGNHACAEGEIIGLSIFEHDVEEEPRFYWSTRRVVGFLHALGYDCEQLPDKNVPYAERFAEDMGVWPAENSIEHAGDMIVIKLSEVSE